MSSSAPPPAESVSGWWEMKITQRSPAAGQLALEPCGLVRGT